MISVSNKKDRATAALITLLITALLLLFFFLYKIITPNPPFPMAADGGEELNFGIYNEGTGNIEGPAIGDATSVVVEKSSSTNAEDSDAKEDNYKTGEAVVEKKQNHPKIKNNKTVITPTKTKADIQKGEEDAAAKKLLNAYTNNKNKQQGGGDGNSGEAGNEGSPDGNPNTDGKGGTANNPNFKGNGNGQGGSGITLKGRKILIPPPKIIDQYDQGIVVVEITVDKQGNVIKAEPNGKGTNTPSSSLKSKARQAALQAKFSPSDKYEEQKGTIVFKFQF
ncbi:MAG: energy transducer TonB [Bacteroidia bacterium]